MLFMVPQFFKNKYMQYLYEHLSPESDGILTFSWRLTS